MTNNATTNLSCIHDVRDIKLNFDWKQEEAKIQDEVTEIISAVKESIHGTPARSQILAWLSQIDLKLEIIKDVLHKKGYQHVHFRYNHYWNEDHTEILSHKDVKCQDDLRKQYIIRDQIYEHLGTTTEMMIATTKYVNKFHKNVPKFRNIEISNDEYNI